MRDLIKAGPGNEMVSGVKPSLDPLTAALWVDGRNVIFRKMGIEKAPGHSPFYEVQEDVRELAQAYVNGTRRIYWAGGKKVRYWEENDPDGQIYSYPSNADIRLETWGSWLLSSNGVHPPQLWKDGETNPIADLPFEWAKHILRHNVYMLAANTSNGEQMIEWCAASNVEDWVPTRFNSAGNIFIRDLDSEIKAFVTIGKNIAVYSEESLAIGRWVGQPYIYDFKTELSGIGAVGPRSIIPLGPRNYGMGRQGIFITDGSDFKYVDEPDVQSYLQDTIDWEQPEKIIGYHNNLLEQVIWHYPTQDGGWGGIPFSYKNGVFGAPLTGRVSGAMRRFVFDQPIACVNKHLAFLNTGVNAGDEAMESWIRTKPLDAGDGNFGKLWQYLRLTGQWTGGKVRLGALRDPNDLSSVEWFFNEAMALEHFPQRDTPYLIIEFSASFIDETFRISQFLAKGEVTGLVGA